MFKWINGVPVKPDNLSPSRFVYHNYMIYYAPKLGHKKKKKSDKQRTKKDLHCFQLGYCISSVSLYRVLRRKLARSVLQKSMNSTEKKIGVLLVFAKKTYLGKLIMFGAIGKGVLARRA